MHGHILKQQKLFIFWSQRLLAKCSDKEPNWLHSIHSSNGFGRGQEGGVIFAGVHVFKISNECSPVNVKLLQCTPHVNDSRGSKWNTHLSTLMRRKWYKHPIKWTEIRITSRSDICHWPVGPSVFSPCIVTVMQREIFTAMCDHYNSRVMRFVSCRLLWPWVFMHLWMWKGWCCRSGGQVFIVEIIAHTMSECTQATWSHVTSLTDLSVQRKLSKMPAFM